jgi:hypothetical protein
VDVVTAPSRPIKIKWSGLDIGLTIKSVLNKSEPFDKKCTAEMNYCVETLQQSILMLLGDSVLTSVRDHDNIQLVPLTIKPRKTTSTGESIMLLMLWSSSSVLCTLLPLLVQQQASLNKTN